MLFVLASCDVVESVTRCFDYNFTIFFFNTFHVKNYFKPFEMQENSSKIEKENAETASELEISAEECMKIMKNLEDRRNARMALFKKKQVDLAELDEKLASLFSEAVKDPNFSFRFVKNEEVDDLGFGSYFHKDEEMINKKE